jgi:hypothetical protein
MRALFIVLFLCLFFAQSECFFSKLKKKIHKSNKNEISNNELIVYGETQVLQASDDLEYLFPYTDISEREFYFSNEDEGEETEHDVSIFGIL